MQVVVSLVPPEVFAAWKSLSEQIEDGQNGITRDVLIDFFEFVWINTSFSLEANLKNFVHLLETLDPLIEAVKTTAFPGELAFSLSLLLQVLEVDHWERGHHGADVILRNQSIAVEVVDLENELDFLVEGRAIEAEQASQELPLIQVVVAVRVHYMEESLT